MILKWIKIIKNWINCYFADNENNEQSLTLESLLNIISHLRENLNLDESKSSTLEAHSLDEFILEKYPEFRFENGSLEASTEEDLYMAASLLLLFICVNSKDIDMKNAMCSQLNVEDQEVILKFSRFLMECSPIKVSDVNAAIHDACGPSIGVTDLERSCTSVVSETPPALRSLHGEVRRLQAALEAERFDRNYLQEELSRTNLKFDKLMKNNEDYKQEVIKLKAKISMCCGHENNVKASDEAVQGTAKLLREIQLTEERLVETQGQLEDALYERDTYRSKVNELKQERDKWLALSQQQTDLVSQLTEELEGERQTTLSLRELVAELRQHNHLTRMDSSQIECDDPNASIHSFQHNTSFCSEACANVVEVQLVEERAKIEDLKQQMQLLQEQLQEMSQKYETEKSSLEKIISDKDDDIFNLKHRINEEIEINNNMTVHYSDAFSKLNNDVNELEQKLKDANVQSRLVIEMKMQEIQTLQEEKLSLLQSLHDETTKLNKNIKKLERDLEYERNVRTQQKEDYENHIMKLNEKVLNRNNELVELQNNVLEKSEQIEELHLEIRNEKLAREKIMQQHHNELEVLNKTKLDTQNNLQQKQSEIEILSNRLKQNSMHNEKLNNELQIIRNSMMKLKEACCVLEDNKILLLNEIGNRDNKLLQQDKEIVDLMNLYSQEKEMCQKQKDEYDSKTAMLSDEIHKAREAFKVGANVAEAQLGEERAKIEVLKQQSHLLQEQLQEMSQKHKTDKSTLEKILSDKDDDIFNLKHRINEEIETVNELEQKLKDGNVQSRLVIEKKMQEIQTLQEEKLSLLQSLHDETTKLDKNIKNLERERNVKTQQKEDYDNYIVKLNEKVLNRNNELVELQNNVLEKSEQIEGLHLEIRNEKLAREKIMQQHHNELEVLNKTKLDTENNLQQKQSEIEILSDRLKQKSMDNEKLNNELQIIRNSVMKLKEACCVLEDNKILLLNENGNKDNKLLQQDKEIVDLKNKYSQEKEKCQKQKDEYDSKIAMLSDEIHKAREAFKAGANVAEVQLGEERAKIEVLKQQSHLLQEQLQEMSQKYETDKSSLQKIISDKDDDILNLKHRFSEEIENVYELEQKLKDANFQSRLVIEMKMQEIQTLQEEKLSLLQSLHDETTKLDKNIKNLERERNVKTQQKEDYDNYIVKLNEKVLNRNNELVELQNNVLEKSEQIEGLHLEIRNEKLAREKIMQQHHNELEVLNKTKLDTENNLQQKLSEIEILSDRLKQKSMDNEKLNNELQIIRNSVMKLKEACCVLEDNKILLLNEIGNKDNKLLQQDKEIVDLKNKYSQEKEKCQKQKDEYDSKIAMLSDEIHKAREAFCSEACANVAAVQLGEERAKIEVLKQQIYLLQEQLQEMTQKYETDKSSPEKIISDKDDDIFNPKHRISEEIEKVNELEQKLNDANFQSRLVIEMKMQEIQTLQEDKLSLLQSLHDETTKLDKNFKKLERELEYERNVKSQQKEDYENHIMKLNEKVLYQNNELVELQNNVLEKSEQIDGLDLEIRNEKLAREKIMQQHHDELEVLNKTKLDTENNLQQKQSEIEILNDRLKQKSMDNEKLNNELQIIKKSVMKLKEACCVLEDNKILLLNEIGNKDNKLLQQDKEIVDLKNKYSQEKEKCQKQKDEYDSKIAMLSDEIHKAREDSDLHAIIDKNRTITILQTDINYLKSMIADSENKILDYTKELEISNENNQQLSSQLKKIVCHKNEEIADLKRQMTKMSATENRASQIIRVSAKYQAIILKRIAEIKTNTVLKELTNFGNSNGDNELRRSLNAGTITMEDLENFLETTDKHLRRCSEKQIALQKERDRLFEVNRINESEIINMRKFLTELSVSFQTFNSIKDMYTQKLTRVVSMQRTVRRELLNLDGRVSDASMFKLERGYAAVMQDLTECVMNIERWVERSIGRKISSEKIKQAFMSDDDRLSLASTTFQNKSLEVQLEELENSFKKLLEEILRAQRDGNAKDPQAATIMELRVEYEDKLNRMKAKMKELYKEQIDSCMAKQKKVIDSLERELAETREKLKVTSKAYEDHIRGLATDLWNVSEKFLATRDELGWLQKKQRSGSLMSLQHVHSSGLLPRNEEQCRVSDAASLRSLPVHNETNKREGRGLHMSDEEGEVFDNRWLQELSRTPRDAAPRLSELRRRNSLCPPHLKSSYPAETQFAPALDEEDIKCVGPAGSLGGRNQRKEVGITAYKKPGPPTPSKQAGRLSATDSELRESLRLDPEANVSRKTSTPSRLRSLFRSSRSETAEGTPRSRRMSIFRKK